MPRIILYPRTNLEKCIELAKTVFRLGGKSDLQSLAKAMNKPLSGVFTTTIGSCVKYGLLVSKHREVELTELGKNVCISSGGELRNYLFDCFNQVMMFRELFDHLEDEKISKEYIAGRLIHEFDVPEKDSGKVAKYFIENLTLLHLLENHVVLPFEPFLPEEKPPEPKEVDKSESDLEDREKDLKPNDNQPTSIDPQILADILAKTKENMPSASGESAKSGNNPPDQIKHDPPLSQYSDDDFSLRIQGPEIELNLSLMNSLELTSVINLLQSKAKRYFKHDKDKLEED